MEDSYVLSTVNGSYSHEEHVSLKVEDEEDKSSSNPNTSKFFLLEILQESQVEFLTSWKGADAFLGQDECQACQLISVQNLMSSPWAVLCL